MSNMYVDYVKEREGLDTLERPEGFLMYKIDPSDPHLFIAEIYVAPEHREKKIASSMANEVFAIAKDEGCSMAFCQCDVSSKTTELSLFAIKNYGFREYTKDGDLVQFFMEIQ